MSEKRKLGSVSGRTFKAKIIEEDVLFIQIDGESEFGLDDAKELLQTTESLAKGRKVYTLCDLDPNMHPNDKARDFVISDDATAYSHAHAFVVKSLAQKVIVDYMIRFQKPNVPMKLFSSVDTAMNWLRLLKSDGNTVY